MHIGRSVLAALAVLASGATPAASDTATFELDVRARPIEFFRIGSDQKRFGNLEFAGGLELSGSSRHFGALSGLHVFSDQSRILGVTDTGFWYAGRIERGADGRPSGLSEVSMSEMSGPSGAASHSKWESDAEGVTVEGDTAYVSFERRHRIARYDAAGSHPGFLSEYEPPVPLYELRRNKGFETVAVAPPGSQLAGALVGVSERSLDKAGNIMAFARWPDGASFEFSVERRGEFDTTDGKFLPDGDLILLERRFNVRDGVAMRLRRIDGSDIVKGRTVDGEILLEADLLYQIDNMEGLSVTVDPDGAPRLTLVSDDNHSILQRNLLLEFRLVGEREQARR